MSNRTAVAQLIEEFLLINVPILIYVMIESHHQGEELLAGVASSPEWCIGTVVMSFQSLRLYFYGTAAGPKKAAGLIVSLMLITVVITAGAFYLLSMNEHSSTAVLMKWVAFGSSSVLFAGFGGAGLWAESHYEED